MTHTRPTAGSHVLEYVLYITDCCGVGRGRRPPEQTFMETTVEYIPWFSTVHGSVLAKAQSAWLILQREIMHSR